MQVRIAADSASSVTADALVVPIFSDGTLDGAAAEIDAILGGTLAGILRDAEISSKAGELSLVHAADKPFRRVLVLGLGDRAKFSPSALNKYAGTAVRYLGKRNAKTIAIALPKEAGRDTARSASFVAEGALAGIIDTTTYRTEPDKPVVTLEVLVLASGLDEAAVQAGIARGSIVGQAVNFARRPRGRTRRGRGARVYDARRSRDEGQRDGLPARRFARIG